MAVTAKGVDLMIPPVHMAALSWLAWSAPSITTNLVGFGVGFEGTSSS